MSCPAVEAVLDGTCWTGGAGPVRAADHFLEGVICGLLMSFRLLGASEGSDEVPGRTLPLAAARLGVARR